jgi:hypothetical protein
MISNSLSTSERWAALYGEAGKLAEFCQVLFVLLVSHADDHGRLKGSPFTVKHLVIPTSPRSLESVERALIHLHRVELIQWYEHEADKYIQINHFGDHQSLKGHDSRPSKYPDPPKVAQLRPELPKPALREEKRTEEKRREENSLGDGEKPPTPTHDFLAWFFDAYKKARHGATYRITQKHAGIVKGLLATYPAERLRQHTEILFTTDEAWVETTDRGIEVLAGKINWLEERLCAWEKRRHA